MFRIHSSFFFSNPVHYYGSEDIGEEFEMEEGEFDSPSREIFFSNPAQNRTGMYLHFIEDLREDFVED